MAAIARLEIERDGKRFTRRVQLLGATDEGREDDGLLYYRFPAELRAIIRKSSIFARLRTEVIFALSSKYALALYEIVQKRGNLAWRRSEEFTVERFRQMLGVEPGKLEQFKHLNLRAIQPAVAEVNGLCDFGCVVEPVLAGRKVVKIKLSWWCKNTDELKAAYRELQAAKIGRKARLEGKVERIVPPSDEPTPTIPKHLEQKMAAAIAHAEPASPPSPAVTHIDKPTEEDIPDARATLERIRREHAAQREQEQRVRAERERREAARKPVFDDD